MSSLRHKSRECALQMLFQWDIGHQEPSRIEDGFWRMAPADKRTKEFANELFEGTVASAGELDVLVAARDGATVADIAQKLFLSEGTVRNYLSAAIAKTGVRNRTEAVRTADERGWL